MISEQVWKSRGAFGCGHYQGGAAGLKGHGFPDRRDSVPLPSICAYVAPEPLHRIDRRFQSTSDEELREALQTQKRECVRSFSICGQSGWTTLQAIDVPASRRASGGGLSQGRTEYSDPIVYKSSGTILKMCPWCF